MVDMLLYEGRMVKAASFVILASRKSPFSFVYQLVVASIKSSGEKVSYIKTADVFRGRFLLMLPLLPLHKIPLNIIYREVR